MIFDFTFYSNEFGGKLNEGDFQRYAQTARDIVSLLTGLVCDSQLPDSVCRALCLETDYIAANGYSGRAGSFITGEKLGDYSVSYSKNGDTVCGGIPVSPEAEAALRSAGFISRWV